MPSLSRQNEAPLSATIPRLHFAVEVDDDTQRRLADPGRLGLLARAGAVSTPGSTEGAGQSNLRGVRRQRQTPSLDTSRAPGMLSPASSGWHFGWRSAGAPPKAAAVGCANLYGCRSRRQRQPGDQGRDNPGRRTARPLPCLRCPTPAPTEHAHVKPSSWTSCSGWRTRQRRCRRRARRTGILGMCGR